jgi:predicted dehydrogenase
VTRRRQSLTRREFLGTSALAAASLTAASCGVRSAPGSRPRSPSDRLNIGIIGAGGRGANNLAAVASQNIVAICDVDERRAAEAFATYSRVPRYQDFRRMLDRERSLDAVVISTPDHTHAVAAVAAMQRGLHVYCEKPLARTIWEARLMRQVAAESRVVTQMGTQGHAFEGSRRAVEVIRAGTIGDVSELHVWTDRPAGWWLQGVERPSETPSVPGGLDWDLWLGPAPWRAYHPAYVPFTWRGWYDFGTGAIGDMGVHDLDTAYWALELGLPVSAEAKDSARRTDESPPEWDVIELRFAARGARPPVTLTFYSGKRQPPVDLFHGEPIPDNGSLIVGSKGTLFTRTWNGGRTPEDMFLLLPLARFEGFTPPTPSLPRVPAADDTGHHQEWIRACRGDGRTFSDFSYASQLTEALLVGLLAVRTGHRIEWNAAEMRATGTPDADPFIRPVFRQGWELTT